MGVDCCFYRIAAAQGEVTANMRLKPIQTTDRGESGVTAFYNVSMGSPLWCLLLGVRISLAERMPRSLRRRSAG
jgi:hypothetical protein